MQKSTSKVTKNKPKPKLSAAKSAKFSSLFKNNKEIPKLGDVKAQTTPSKEPLFSCNSFADMPESISPHLIDCLQKRFQLERMTQIQSDTMPNILAGRDCFVKSQTGSGKTLAYAVPIVQKLQAIQPRLKRSDGIRALVLVPTRELALQTCQVFEKLCNACVWIVAGCLIGGMKKKAEKDRIRRGLNILVATPGRLCDHLDTTMALDLSKLQFLIFDEADRMLDMDFEKKINFIIFKIHSAKKKALAEPEPPKFRLDAHGEPVEIEPASLSCQPARVDPQTILISATLTSGIKEIARRLNVVDPVHIDEAPGAQVNVTGIDREKEDEITLPARLSHFYTIVPSKLRLVSLIAFILDKFVYNKVAPKTKMLVFASTNDSVQFHEAILRTFINRKFSLYLDNDGDDEVADMDVGSDIDEFIANEDDDSFELNLKKGTTKKPKKLAGKKTTKIQKKSAPTLNSGNNLIDVFALYGNMEQHKRADILSKYCQSDSGILICTDVAARGLDMPNIDWIVQFNPPTSRFDYVHRVGRTARVGHRGSGLIYLEPAETAYLDELKKLNINIKEVKLDSIMECLNLEGKFYPRQINSDSLKFPRNQEECANSMQFYVEEYVEQSPETHELARKAYMSFIRSYSTYSSELKSIFYVKNLHLGHVAKSFGLREAPSEITLDRKPRERPTFNRDRPRPNDRSGLNGLLRNYKSVSEFDSGFDRVASKKGVGKKRSLADRIKKLSPASTPAASGRPQQAKNIKKIIKKNMDIFD